jgi:hypothetical protein
MWPVALRKLLAIVAQLQRCGYDFDVCSGVADRSGGVTTTSGRCGDLTH